MKVESPQKISPVEVQTLPLKQIETSTSAELELKPRKSSEPKQKSAEPKQKTAEPKPKKPQQKLQTNEADIYVKQGRQQPHGSKQSNQSLSVFNAAGGSGGYGGQNKPQFYISN